MRLAKGVLARLALLLAICGTAVTTHAADDGLITKPSRYSVKETIARFEAAVKDREATGATVFTEIDHAAAAKKLGLDIRPRTVIVFGNPKVGTPVMVKTPLLAIDVPPKALSGRMIKVRFGYRIIPPTICTKRSTRGTVLRHRQRQRRLPNSWMR